VIRRWDIPPYGGLAGELSFGNLARPGCGGVPQIDLFRPAEQWQHGAAVIRRPPGVTFIMTKERRNEIRKLRATGLNGVATSTVAIGILTPIVGYSLELTPKPIPLPSVLIVIGGAVIGAIAIHFVARSMLRRYE
jgi:hypothetical protein